MGIRDYEDTLRRVAGLSFLSLFCFELPSKLLSRRRPLQRFSRFAVIGIEAKRFSIRRDRIAPAAELQIYISELVVRLGVVGIGFQRQLEGSDRRLEFPLAYIDDAEIVVHIGIGRVQ